MYKLMLSSNKDNLTSFFWVWMHLISFSCLTALARTSSSMLNRNSHPCLVPDLKGKAFNLSPSSKILAVDLTYMDYYVEVCSFYTLLKGLIMKDVELTKCFFCIN